MSEIKLYRIGQGVKELESTTVALEKELQTLVETHMETLFGVRFLKSEYVISGGRMDSIGIDENNCPVIFEYKRSQNENVINQGLFYLDWLLDHKADFRWLVHDTLGPEVADAIDWSVPSVVCIAHEFTKYDVHAVNRMKVNIRLVKYRRYRDDLILFEHINVEPTASESAACVTVQTGAAEDNPKYKTHDERVAGSTEDIRIIYEELCDFIESLGDEVVRNQLKYYVAYKKVRNFVCIEAHQKLLNLCLTINPQSIQLEEGFSRDVSSIGHWGTGNIEVKVKTVTDMQKAKELIVRAYNEA